MTQLIDRDYGVTGRLGNGPVPFLTAFQGFLVSLPLNFYDLYRQVGMKPKSSLVKLEIMLLSPEDMEPIGLSVR